MTSASDLDDGHVIDESQCPAISRSNEEHDVTKSVERFESMNSNEGLKYDDRAIKGDILKSDIITDAHRNCDDDVTGKMISDTASKVYAQLLLQHAGASTSSSSTQPTSAEQVPVYHLASTQQHVLGNIPQCIATEQGIFSQFKLTKNSGTDSTASPEQEFTMKFHSCRVCKQLFETADALWEHALVHNSNPRYRCPKQVCKFTCDTIEQLVDHQVTLHISDEGSRIDFGGFFEPFEKGTHLYTCGADRYMQAVMEAAGATGYPEENLHLEYLISIDHVRP